MVLAHNINEGHRTQDVQISEDVTFDTMLLTPNTLEGLTNCGFYKPSPIQLHGIPLGKCGFDLLLEAKSGTGKTAVFTVIALEKLDLEGGLQTVILAPTREIAAQICDVVTQIGSNYKNLNVQVVIGGLPIQEDIMKFKKKVHIVVGSPGRLRYLIQANHIDISAVRLLVLDEADKLMDKNFQADINYIFSVLPKEKQVIMSSATYPETLKTIMNKYVQNAQHMCPDSSSVLLGIKQLVITVKSNTNIVRQTQNRFEELLKILSKKNFKQCLIFCNYQVRVRDLCKMLLRQKWPAEQLHGQQEQNVRLDALRMLQDYKCRILISTDLAARGIDASNIDLVINFEPPHEWQTYLHRIGRAGRFGSYGIAVTILSEGQEEIKFKKMLNSINCSLELKNFWDEENIALDECDSSSTYQGVECNEAYNDLLKKLTGGDHQSVEDTDSFETLCNSFKKTKESEIESFNDLLTCFESHKVEKSSIAAYKICCNKQSNDDLTSAQNHDLASNINRGMVDILTKQTDNPEPIKRIEHCMTSKQHLESLDNRNVDEENKFPDCDLELNKALLDADLPTAFGSSKYRKTKAKKKNSKCLNNNFKNDDQQDNITENKMRKEKCSTQKAHMFNKNTNYEELQVDSDKYINNNKVKNNCNSKDNDEEIENNCIRSKSYEMWYCQLKTHIAQIQMYVYIDELSKM